MLEHKKYQAKDLERLSAGALYTAGPGENYGPIKGSGDPSDSGFNPWVPQPNQNPGHQDLGKPLVRAKRHDNAYKDMETGYTQVPEIDPSLTTTERSFQMPGRNYNTGNLGWMSASAFYKTE
ncbi:MAG: hypothetical protein ABEJ02_02605 [Candidatus Paceibacteria bacterium]